ncbi:Os06g0682000 [Oryza sativa Japonica Group]|uniref:Os06g0682000 protein n=1 Tax=Oryza sativa subsp. japonica TaxID=39947 RepID=A0A0P0X027_ORYSJ|nr:Os06g0682000 [Oryza sativa Japonica Group]
MSTAGLSTSSMSSSRTNTAWSSTDGEPPAAAAPQWSWFLVPETAASSARLVVGHPRVLRAALHRLVLRERLHVLAVQRRLHLRSGDAACRRGRPPTPPPAEPGC